MPHPGRFTPGNDPLPTILKYIFILFLMNIISPTIVEIMRTFLADYFVLIVVTLLLTESHHLCHCCNKRPMLI